MTSRWREENYFRYGRAHFALDALDSYAVTAEDPGRMVPNPAKKAAAAAVKTAKKTLASPGAARQEKLTALRSPAPATSARPHNPPSAPPRPRRTPPADPAPWPPSASRSAPPEPATPEPISSCATRLKNTQALHELLRYVRSPGARGPDRCRRVPWGHGELRSERTQAARE